MKKISDAEAIERGYNLDVMPVWGEMERMEVVSTVAHNEYDLNFPISVDSRIHTLEARMAIPSDLYKLKFRSIPPHDHRIKPKFMDAIGLSNATPDNGILLGVSTIVSESARDKLLDFLDGECSFIPVEVIGAPQQYYILWVHKICDALDESRSRLTDASDNMYKNWKRPMRTVFQMEKITAKYLFRLPQWKYDMNRDIATPAFRDLVRDQKISGFNFQAGGIYGPFLK